MAVRIEFWVLRLVQKILRSGVSFPLFDAYYLIDPFCSCAMCFGNVY